MGTTPSYDGNKKHISYSPTPPASRSSSVPQIKPEHPVADQIKWSLTCMKVNRSRWRQYMHCASPPSSLFSRGNQLNHVFNFPTRHDHKLFCNHRSQDSCSRVGGVGSLCGDIARFMCKSNSPTQQISFPKLPIPNWEIVQRTALLLHRLKGVTTAN